jgi:hypothetical protein
MTTNPSDTTNTSTSTTSRAVEWVLETLFRALNIIFWYFAISGVKGFFV